MRPRRPKLTAFAMLPPVNVGIGGLVGPVGVLVALSVESDGPTVVEVPFPGGLVLPPVGVGTVVKPELVGQSVSVLRHSVTVTVSVSLSVVESLGGGRVGVGSGVEVGCSLSVVEVELVGGRVGEVVGSSSVEVGGGRVGAVGVDSVVEEDDGGGWEVEPPVGGCSYGVQSGRVKSSPVLPEEP